MRLALKIGIAVQAAAADTRSEPLADKAVAVSLTDTRQLSFSSLGQLTFEVIASLDLGFFSYLIASMKHSSDCL